MAVQLSRDDYDRFVTILADMDEMQLPDRRVDFIREILAGSPQRRKIMSRLDLNGQPRGVAGRVTEFFCRYGQDRQGREILSLMVTGMLSKMGEGEDAVFLRGLRITYRLEGQVGADDQGIGQPPPSVEGNAPTHSDAARIRQSVVRIEDLAAKPLGSGFFVGPDRIVTCAHVIDGVQEPYAFCSWTGERYPVIVAAVDRQEDIALLRILDPAVPGATILILGTSMGAVGRRFWSYGYPRPFADRGKWAGGTIQGIDDHGDLQLDAKDIEQGMSGAPVYDVHHGTVVGMVRATFRTSGSPFRDARFALPAERIQPMLDTVNLAGSPIPGTESQPEQAPDSSPAFRPPPLPATGVVGRKQLLTDVVTALALHDPTATDVPPLALQGMGGIGKTTMAALLGRLPEVQRHYPDGVLWVSLGTKPTIRLAQDAWGRALGIDLLPERDEAACRARLQEALFSRRCLLLVDDVWETNHGRQFAVPGPGSRLLFTTRETKVAHDLATRARTMRVDLLSPKAALDLLARLAPEAVKQEPALSRKLLARLEYLPLGISLGGKLLANEADVPARLTSLMHELIERREDALSLVSDEGRYGAEDDAPASVKEILDLSVQRLDKADRERFAMAALFGGDPLTWDLDLAAHVWQCAPEAAGATVQRLIQRGLVERRGERFWMHALLAEYAVALLDQLGL